MTKLRLALQKSGRLREDSISLIREMGINITRQTDLLRYESSNFPVEFIFLRDDDIPDYVSSGVADVGIVGENVISEQESEAKVQKKLGFAACRLSIAVPLSSPAKSIEDLNGKKIATSYPNILKKYAKDKSVKIKVHFTSGSVEVAPAIDLASAVFDIVSTGSTLLQNGLREIETIMHSQAVLIASNEIAEDKKKIFEDFLFRLNAVQLAQDFKYVIFNAPKIAVERIKTLLPGLKNPTISTLSDPEWVSYGAVVKESDFWSVLSALKENGAQGILVTPIEKMII